MKKIGGLRGKNVRESGREAMAEESEWLRVEVKKRNNKVHVFEGTEKRPIFVVPSFT